MMSASSLFRRKKSPGAVFLGFLAKTPSGGEDFSLDSWAWKKSLRVLMMFFCFLLWVDP